MLSLAVFLSGEALFLKKNSGGLTYPVNIYSLQLSEQSVIIANWNNGQNYKITLKSCNKAMFL